MTKVHDRNTENWGTKDKGYDRETGLRLTESKREPGRPGMGYLKGLVANSSIMGVYHQAGRLGQPRSLTYGTQDSCCLILKGTALAGPLIPCRLRFRAPSSLGPLYSQYPTASGLTTGCTEHCPRLILCGAGRAAPGQTRVCGIRGRKRAIS